MSSEVRQQGLNSPLWPIATCVLWMVCLTTGVLGLRIGYPGPRIAADAQEFPPTQLVTAQLTPQPAPPPEPAPPPPAPSAAAPSDQPPVAAPAPLILPAQPAVVAVAPPGAAVAFAVPTEGLTHVVEASQAGYTRLPLVTPAPTGGGDGTGNGPPPAPPPPKPVAPARAPVVRRLTYEEGEGRQPKPEYPRDAVLAGEEGTVGVRFTVGADGRVLAVDVTAPSRWPLLNQSARRTVQDKWRFDPGPQRIFDYAFEFHIDR